MKKLMKDTFMLAGTGVGLGVMAGVSETAAPAIGTLASGVGKVAPLMMVGHGVRFVDKVMPKKKGGWY